MSRLNTGNLTNIVRSFKRDPYAEDSDGITMNPVGEDSQLISSEKHPDANRQLAKRILDLNPNLPKAYKSKFEVMAVNTHFATNVVVVIEDCKKNGIVLNLSEID